MIGLHTWALVVTLTLSTGSKDVVVYDEPFPHLSACMLKREAAVNEVMSTYNARGWDSLVVDAEGTCATVHERIE